MHRLRLISKDDIPKIEDSWNKESLKFNETAQYAKALFVHARSIQDPAKEGQYYVVPENRLLAHISEVILPNDHHKTLYCSEFISCPDLQFDNNTCDVDSKLLVYYRALVKGVMLIAQEKKINKIKIFSPKEVSHHFWHGVLVLFQEDVVDCYKEVSRNIAMHGRFALITIGEEH